MIYGVISDARNLEYPILNQIYTGVFNSKGLIMAGC